jgi:hypothetical protein
VSSQLHTPASVPQGKGPRALWIRDWVGPIAGLGAVKKNLLHMPGIEHRVSRQPVAIPTELSRLLRISHLLPTKCWVREEAFRVKIECVLLSRTLTDADR